MQGRPSGLVQNSRILLPGNDGFRRTLWRVIGEIPEVYPEIMPIPADLRLKALKIAQKRKESERWPGIRPITIAAGSCGPSTQSRARSAGHLAL
jgi:hypothetical protein